MKIFYEHQYGKIETQNLQISNIYASDVGADEQEHALEQGFLQLTENLWYNCRSTRIIPYAINLTHTFEVRHVTNILDIQHYLIIYEKFLLAKGFKSIDEDRLFLENDSVIEYYQNNILVGFSKIRNYTESVELNLHCHVLSNKHFSYLTLQYEIDCYKDKKYVYLGPGYERSSIYKCNLTNFEWFDGQAWHTDKALYTDCCMEDSSLQVTTSL
jgi:hypothetical protein